MAGKHLSQRPSLNNDRTKAPSQSTSHERTPPRPRVDEPAKPGHHPRLRLRRLPGRFCSTALPCCYSSVTGPAAPNQAHATPPLLLRLPSLQMARHARPTQSPAHHGRSRLDSPRHSHRQHAASTFEQHACVARVHAINAPQHGIHTRAGPRHATPAPREHLARTHSPAMYFKNCCSNRRRSVPKAAAKSARRSASG